MSGMLDEVGAYLASIGALSLTVGTNLLVSKSVDTPDALVVLYDAPGGVVSTMGRGSVPIAETPGLQMVVRDLWYDDAYPVARAVWNALAAIQDQTLSGHYYQGLIPRQSPFKMGVDTRERVLVAANFDVMRDAG